MSPAQLKKLQELSLIFSKGTANPQQIQQLSNLLAQINCSEEKELIDKELIEYISAPRFG